MEPSGNQHVSAETSAQVVARLRLLSATFQDTVLGYLSSTADHDDGSDIRLLGIGREEIAAGMQGLEPSAHVSVENLQPFWTFEVDDIYPELTDRSAQRGVRLGLIAPLQVVRANPLATSTHPYLRLAPVFLPLLIVDGSVAVVSGPRTASGQQTAWVVRSTDLVTLASNLWQETWSASVPALADGRPPLSRRQLRVAQLVAQGAADDRICHELDVSRRTVIADVHAVCALVGARSRAEMIAKILTPQF